jgi:hypothetical protein
LKTNGRWILVATLLAAAGCGGTKACKQGTLFVSATFDGPSSGADEVDVEVTVAGGSTKSKTVTHSAHASTGSVEVDFSPYPEGKSVDVTLIARLKGGAQVGMGHGTVSSLASGCGVLAIAIGATDGGQAGSDGGGGVAGGGTDGGGGVAGTGPGGAGGGGSGGVGGTGGDVPPDGGSDAPPGCNPTCMSPTPVCAAGVCVACMEGSGRCNANTPEMCKAGSWVPQTACAGASPVCTNGVCASEQVIGGLATVTPVSTGTVQLLDQGFEFLPRSCSAGTTNQVCVTGGLRP